MKDSTIKFRVTEDEKNNLNDIVSMLGEKNVSTFLRNIINDLSSLMIYRNNNLDLTLLLDKYNNILEDKSLTTFQRYSIKQKINVVNSLIEEINTLPH